MSWLKFGWEVVKMRALCVAAVAILAGGWQRQLVGTAQLVLQLALLPAHAFLGGVTGAVRMTRGRVR